MNKRGVTLAMQLIVVSIVLLFIAAVLLVITQRGFKGFGEGSEEAEEGFFECFCKRPGSGNVCSLENPDKDVTNDDDKKFKDSPKAVPPGCDVWNDCDTKCWEKK